MPLPAVRFENGAVRLADLGLWLDARAPCKGPERVFVSHAHADHTGVHREVIWNQATGELTRARLKGDWIESALPFGEARNFEWQGRPFSVTLLPAGHIFGSSMAWIESEAGSLLYTGDFKLRPGLSAERCEPRPADVLVMETTYGVPRYRFPDSVEVMRGVARFCREALDHEEIPVLIGYSLGKSQEVLCGLAEADLPIMLQEQAHRLTQVYERFGRRFPPDEIFDAETASGKVLLCPPSASCLRELSRTRRAVLTGWAMDPGCKYRYRADAAFPLSDHADYPELVEMVKRVNPKKVFTLHGFAGEFAAALRELGYDAEPLGEAEQLALPLTAPARAPSKAAFREAVRRAATEATRRKADANREAESVDAKEHHERFLTFAETCAAVGQTSKKNEKVQRVSAYLKTVRGAGLRAVSVWLTGKPFSSAENKTLNLGWALIRDALCVAGDLDQEAFGQIYLKHSDLGETAREILPETGAGPALTTREVESGFARLHGSSGPQAKLPILVQLLRQCSALEGKYLIKILTGDLRIGLKEGLLEEAIAASFEAGLEEVKRANLLLSHIGETAERAQRKELGGAGLVPFRPVKYMLASPEKTTADIWKRVAGWHAADAAVDALWRPMSATANRESPSQAAAWLEDKYDGVRCQLHRAGAQVGLYSRDLKEIGASFPELVDAARTLPADCILDGEIVAMRGDEVLPFSELQKRLGRKEQDLFLASELPARFVVFDLLWCSGESFLDRPLHARRSALEKVAGRAAPFVLSRITAASSASEIDEAFAAARGRGNEGLMIKDPASAYAPGRRGLAWLKLKKALATLDCVVVGAEFGHGKRKAVLSDYTFAVRDEATGTLKTIGKTFTGLTDAEIARLTKHFRSRAHQQVGRYFVVEPDVVLEIAFDAVQASSRHNGGLALRFPRIVRIREDKTVDEIDTLDAARAFVRPTTGRAAARE